MMLELSLCKLFKNIYSSDMVRFVKNVKEWFDQDKNNIIAVHCKGGKGRTGTMICVWLVEAGLFGSAEVSISEAKFHELSLK